MYGLAGHRKNMGKPSEGSEQRSGTASLVSVWASSKQW